MTEGAKADAGELQKCIDWAEGSVRIMYEIGNGSKSVTMAEKVVGFLRELADRRGKEKDGP